MIINFLLFFFGLFLLYLGAEFLVRGASKIALMARISPLIVGVTVVAFGTSSPEIIVSFVAAFSNKADLAIGNIVGSNIANIGLILGVSALIRTVKLRKTKIATEVYWMLGASVLFFIFAFNNMLDRWEGIILVSALLIFIILSIKTSLKDRNNKSEADDKPVGKIGNLTKSNQIIVYIASVLTGISILIWGSNITIDSAVFIAREFGISEIIIGLTLVAFGTSLPELATAIISIIKKENAILIGNVIGSNIFNILCVGGLVSSFIAIPIKERVIHFDLPFMMFISLLILPVVFKWNKIPRVFGIFLLMLYFSYIAFSFFNMA
ncbi:MAG: calcium/sodium antiporter [Calditrichia bacterium]|nr:calcium/sodium antiporter [Calditrichia bacterium]